MQWKFPPWHLANERFPPPKLALPSPTLCIQSPSWTTLLENMIKAAKAGGFIGDDSEGHSLFFKGGNQVPEIAEPELAGGWQRARGPRATLPGHVDFGRAA